MSILINIHGYHSKYLRLCDVTRFNDYISHKEGLCDLLIAMHLDITI